MHPRWLRLYLWILVAGLCAFGLTMVFSAKGLDRDGDVTWGFANRQAMAMGVGAVGAVLVSLLGTRRLANGWLVLFLLGFALAALAVALLSGRTINGAKRWIELGFFNLQPAEIAKFAVVVAAAWHFANCAEKIRSRYHTVLLPLLVGGVIAGAVFATKDLGSVLVMGVVFTGMLLFSGGPWAYFLLICLSVAPIAFYKAVFQESYRWDRMLAFYGMGADSAAAYQVKQSLIAIGAGGLAGVGLGNAAAMSIHVPERHTDFIFTHICQELGLIGGVATALAFLLFAILGFTIAGRCGTLHTRLLAVGATLLISAQAFWHMLVDLSLVPTKGLTLPFISYGGSSVVICLALVGILDACARTAAEEVPRPMGARMKRHTTPRWLDARPVDGV
jgi:cell division protein FtsW